jgi:predicted nucleic acid-binding Zn ribbon protein
VSGLPAGSVSPGSLGRADLNLKSESCPTQPPEFRAAVPAPAAAAASLRPGGPTLPESAARRLRRPGRLRRRLGAWVTVAGPGPVAAAAPELIMMLLHLEL